MVTHLFMQNKNLFQIFKWPFVIAVLTLFGLIAALIEEGGVVEGAALAAIAMTVIIIFYFYIVKQ